MLSSVTSQSAVCAGAPRVLTIDVGAVLRSRAPRLASMLPRAAVRLLERVICQDGLNSLLRSNAGLEGADFCRGMLADLGVTYKIEGATRLPDPSERRVVYVSNHPLGALDGIALIEMVSRHHSCEPLFVVNDLLMAVSPLRRVFVPVNKHGGQSRDAASALELAFEGDRPLIVFPAGLVSRRQKRGEIADLPWRKMVATRAVASGRPVVPLYFEGKNSSFFYNFAKLRQRLGIKFNFEMILLPGEVFKCRNRCFTVRVGRRVSCGELAAAPSAAAAVGLLRRECYRLADRGAITE